MRTNRHLAVALLAWAVLPTRALAQTGEPVLVIRNVTVIDGTGARPQQNRNVVIRGSTIAAISAARERVPAGATVVDGTGKYLIPGLIDTHVHVGRLVGTARLERNLAANLAFGVTGVREANAGARDRELVALRGRIERGEVQAPRLYVAGSATPQTRDRYRAATLDELVVQLKESGVDGIKLRQLSSTQADSVIRAARARGLPVFGHTWSGSGTAGYALSALRAGLSGITHIAGIGPARSNQQQRTLLATDWQAAWMKLYTNWIDATRMEEAELLAALIRNNAWLEPTLTTDAFVITETYRDQPEAKLSEQLWSASYDMLRSGFPTYTGSDLELAGQGFARMKRFVRRFHEAGGLVLAGTDMTPWLIGGLHEELRLLVDAGLSPMAALQAATRNASRALGWESVTGTIRVGLAADLVLLDANPLGDIRNTKRIHAVVRAGKLLDRTALDRLLTPN